MSCLTGEQLTPISSFSFTPETDESDSAIGVNWVSSCSDLDPYLMRVNSGTRYDMT